MKLIRMFHLGVRDPEARLFIITEQNITKQNKKLSSQHRYPGHHTHAIVNIPITLPMTITGKFAVALWRWWRMSPLRVRQSKWLACSFGQWVWDVSDRVRGVYRSSSGSIFLFLAPCSREDSSWSNTTLIDMTCFTNTTLKHLSPLLPTPLDKFSSGGRKVLKPHTQYLVHVNVVSFMLYWHHH